MLRALKPIEIAEGALLADIAVIYQVLVTFVPIIGDIFRFPIFIVFAIIVLRRGLYVGLMSGFVALFISCMLMGPSFLVLFMIEIMGGLYLGFVMRHRFHSLPLILFGATFGALAFYCLFFLSTLLTGLPLDTVTLLLHHGYTAALQLLTFLVARLDALFHHGMKDYWHAQLYPLVTRVGDWAFTYWLLAFYLALWCFSLPATVLVYTATNLLVRMLGYDVRPFPGRQWTHLVQRQRRRVFKFALRHHLIRRVHAKV